MHNIAFSQPYRFTVLLIIPFILAGMIFPGCGDDKSTGSDKTEPINPSAEFVSHTGCTTMGGKSPSAYEKCLAYEYDGTGKLDLVSISSWFNCCPVSLAGTISYEDGVISIMETEVYSWEVACDCTCPYDFTYQLTDLPPGEYTIEIEMLSQVPWDYSGVFEISLPASPVADTICKILEPEF